MNKKVILGAILGFSFMFCGLNSHGASAILMNGEDFEPGRVTQQSAEENRCVVEGDIGIPCPDECKDTDGNFIDSCYRTDTGYETRKTPDNSDYENAIHEGTSGEPEVVCADANEPGCEDTEDTSDPELWPMILSFSALGVAFVLVIIINLSRRQK